MLTLRTSVKSSYSHHLLFRGTFLAVIGASLLVFSGIFIPLHLLKTYGFLVIAVSLTLIAVGLIPYRKLKRLETEPNTLELTESSLIYSINKKPIYQIPVNKIKEVTYIENKRTYGINMQFHNHPDLFFPYFSKRAQMQLTNEIKSV